MVLLLSALNSFLVKRDSKLVFPTPESPTRTTEIRKQNITTNTCSFICESILLKKYGLITFLVKNLHAFYSLVTDAFVLRHLTKRQFCSKKKCYIAIILLGLFLNKIITVSMVNVLKLWTLYPTFSWPKFCFLCICFLKYLAEWQTVKTLIRLLLMEQSELGLHCFIMPFCQELSCTNFLDHLLNPNPKDMFWCNNNKKTIFWILPII